MRSEAESSSASTDSSTDPDLKFARRRPTWKGFAGFARTFSRSTCGRKQVLATLLVVGAALTEGIGLALLAPLVALLGEGAIPVESVSVALACVLGAVGLPLALAPLVVIFVALVACRTVVMRARDIALAELRSDFVEYLRGRLHDAITRAAWPFIAKQRVSNLTKALTSDVENVGQGTYFFLQVPAVAVVALVQLIVAVSIAPLLTTLVVACGCVLATLVWLRRGNVYLAGQRFAAAHRAAYDEMSDCLAALKLAKSHNAEERHRERFQETAARQRDLLLDFARRHAESRMLLQLGGAVALGAFVYVGATMAGLPTPALLVLIVIFARLLPLLAELQQGPQVVIHMLPVFDELTALIGRCEEARERTINDDADRLLLRSDVRLANVRFRYPDGDGENVLDGVDLSIPAGAVVAIAGASGAGKSTLADLILGLIVPDSGAVLIDGEPLARARIAAWRRSVAYVPQENFLFNQTVRANLIWLTPQASEKDIDRALAAAGADKVVAGMSLGLETIVGERGNRLSGGERQRLAIARALLRQPTLLILDEATSALDEESEGAIWNVIEGLRGAMTIVIVAHRFSTVQRADLIAVLDRGRILQNRAMGCPAAAQVLKPKTRG